MKPGRIALAIGGALVALLGLGLFVGGGGLTLASATLRDEAGYFNTSTQRLSTDAYALTSDRIDLGARPGRGEWGPFGGHWGTVRLRAARPDGAAVFIGIGPAADVQAYMAGVAHDELVDVNFTPFRVSYQRVPGSQRPSAPAAASFWVAQARGAGQQTLAWVVEPGEWVIVVMNGEGGPGVSVDASVGAKADWVVPLGIVLLILGGVLIAGGALMLFFAFRSQTAAEAERPKEMLGLPAEVRLGSYPARLNGRLDEPLSRWLWLVKWFLAIPHFVVLFFLWVAYAVLTFVAGIAILFTRRYPRSIFDFNVGVMRWTWRVGFYAFDVLGTDKYPPFTLAPDPDYPASFEVDYPEKLSRGLVLVKWWLLAIPHYIVVGLFGAGLAAGSFGWGNEWWFAGGGLIGILVLVAAVVLAFTKRYPKAIFDFVMGMNRWAYRVWAYAGLMRDEYPPFRLDSGGDDPGHIPAPPVAPPGESDRELEPLPV